MKQDRRSLYKVIAFVLILAACFALAHLPVVKDRATLSWMADRVGELRVFFNGTWGPLAFLGLSVLLLMASLPGLLMVVLGALVYDPVRAFLYGWAGANLGTAATFLVARFFLQDYFKPRMERSFLAAAMARIETSGLFLVCVLRLVVFMSPPVNWFLGASNLKTRDYLIGNLIGLAPVVLAVQVTVRQIRAVNSMTDLLRGSSLLIIGIFLAAAIAVWVIRRRFFAKPAQPS